MVWEDAGKYVRFQLEIGVHPGKRCQNETRLALSFLLSKMSNMAIDLKKKMPP